MVISRVKGLLEHINKHILSPTKTGLSSFKAYSIDDSPSGIIDSLNEDIDVLVADPNHEYLLKNIDSKFPNLKFMQCTFAGVNALINGSTRRLAAKDSINTLFLYPLVKCLYAYYIANDDPGCSSNDRLEFIFAYIEILQQKAPMCHVLS